MKFSLTLIILFLIHYSGVAQVTWPSIKEMDSTYHLYKETSIDKKRFGIKVLAPLLEHFKLHPELEVRKAGYSIEERPIYLVKYGNGPIPILFWSQMHGDESTATMALVDLFHWLVSDVEQNENLLDQIKNKCTLYFIPMLNPDGAEEFQRRNSANIDLNRDAVHLANPESEILKSIRDSIRPKFGFNLHDQSQFYRAGQNGKQVALAFLAPAFNHAKDINRVRMEAMQLIAMLNDSLSNFIPDRIAKYDDTFEPRAFGDNFQKWGTSTILIESGGYPGDLEKQELRKLNFITYIKALEGIINQNYFENTIGDYNSIPFNESKMLSLIIDNLKIKKSKKTVKTSLGYRYYDTENEGKTTKISSIADIGDLSVYTGINTFDAEGYDLIIPKVYPEKYIDISMLSKEDWEKNVRNGYLAFILDKVPEKIPGESIYLLQEEPASTFRPFLHSFDFNSNPTFILKKGNDIKVVKNGTIYDIQQIIDNFKHYLEN
ncbi:M14 family zinc carboxypeptidase [Membranihabitans maritimus]|uniref:M14 family zinc carboxypeptidase n=1 Tax=Membranihabitans maritimus TaxID=2904244 RepID=UPI001F2C690B|nr:M14 family zinc carboxypeptidase [Membranihabitans maritimus]